MCERLQSPQAHTLCGAGERLYLGGRGGDKVSENMEQRAFPSVLVWYTYQRYQNTLGTTNSHGIRKSLSLTLHLVEDVY